MDLRYERVLHRIAALIGGFAGGVHRTDTAEPGLFADYESAGNADGAAGKKITCRLRCIL